MGEGRHFPIGSLVIGLCFGVVLLSTWLLVRPPPPPAGLEGILRGEFRPIGSFLLSSRDHGPISEASLRGKWSFLFFGYTACPDVCPNTLHELGSLWNRLRDERGGEPSAAQVIFISVDPARDTPERLASYVAYFDPAFIGATAGRGQIDRLARQFGAGYRREEETAPGQYNVAHSGAIFLVDPLGRLVATFSQPHYAATIHAQFRQIEAYFSGAARPGAGALLSFAPPGHARAPSRHSHALARHSRALTRHSRALTRHSRASGNLEKLTSAQDPGTPDRRVRKQDSMQRGGNSAVAAIAFPALANRPRHEGADQRQVEGEADPPERQWRSAVVDRRGRRSFGLRDLRVVHGVAV